MMCQVCKKEVFSKSDVKEPKAFLSMNPQNKDDFRCLEHKNE